MTRPRVIIHPGFHKTGTSSVQSHLREVRAAWAPRYLIALREDFRDVTAAAQAFSRSRDPIELGLFQAGLAEWAEGLDLSRTEVIVISAETLAGKLPGAPASVSDYTAAPALMAAAAEVLRMALGAKTRIDFYLSTRAPEAWLASLHWQHVRSGRLSEPAADFAARMAPGADLAAAAQAITARVAPDPVHVVALEDTRDLPEGPLTPLLDLMGVPAGMRAGLAQPHAFNARPPRAAETGLADRLAEINRLAPSPEIAETRRKELLRAAWAEDARQKGPPA